MYNKTNAQEEKRQLRTKASVSISIVSPHSLCTGKYTKST